MWTLDFRTQEVGGPVAGRPAVYDEDGRRVDYNPLASPLAADGVTFVVHGYNNNRAEGLRAESGFVRELERQIPALAGTLFVGVLWPGDAVTGFLSYPTEEADADRTAVAFARALYETDFPKAPHFVAHSLGCRVTLRALDLLAYFNPERAWADQVILLAGAVDNDVLARGDRYREAVENVSRVVNVASTEDRVLKWAFPAGDFLAGLFGGGGYTKTALGRKGPASSPAPPPNVRRIQLRSAEDVGHGDYLGGANPKQQRISALAGRAITLYEPLQY